MSPHLMWTRREVLIGGILTAVCSDGFVKSGNEGSSSDQCCCMLSAREAEPLLQQASQPKPIDEPIIFSSGDRDFDFALAQTLSRISDLFQVLPGFAFYDDWRRPNAHATTFRRLGYSDGTVLFGRNLLQSVLAEIEAPDAAVTAICAHEFAHILQFKKGLVKSIGSARRSVKPLELHADFLSGYYAGAQKLRKPNYPATVFVVRAYNTGDYGIRHPQHHGLPTERAEAVIRGFEAAYRERRTLSEAMQVAFNFVASMGEVRS